MPDDHYTHGHEEPVLAAHSWRTADNSASYLLPHLVPGLTLLDVGCGPGSVTRDLARLIAPGRVVGVDRDAAIVALAEAAADGVPNLTFEVADAYSLPFVDGQFDIVHAHQVLQHLSDPVAAMREMARVTRRGGLIAARDSDYAAMVWYPPSNGLDAWREVYRAVALANGGEPDAGRRLLAWAHAAGFADVTPSASTWCFAAPADREWWGETWAQRTTDTAYGRQAIALGLTDSAGLAAVAEAWRAWAADADGWIVVVSGEILVRVPDPTGRTFVQPGTQDWVHRPETLAWVGAGEPASRSAPATAPSGPVGEVDPPALGSIPQTPRPGD